MKKIFILFFFFYSCNPNLTDYEKTVENVVLEWSKKNPRVSNNFKIFYRNRNIEVLFQEKSKTSSFVIEDIASCNLAYKIFEMTKDISKFDSIKILYEQPVENVSYGKEKEEVITEYKFSKSKIRSLGESLSLKVPFQVSEYITFKMQNLSEVEIEESIKLCQELFPWFSFNGDVGVHIILDYSILKSTNSLTEEEQGKYENTLSLLYLTLRDANLNSKSHLDSLFILIDKEIPTQTWEQVDSIGRMPLG